MKILEFLTSTQYGCCTVRELMDLNKQDAEGYKTLRQWATEEMRNRGIEITEK